MNRTLTQTVVEDLYAEALMLADEARAAFDLRDEPAIGPQRSNEERIAMSVEGLRTTTRVMHILAWQLNQRAFLAGELSARQVARSGSLASERPSDPRNMAVLPMTVRSLIRDTERLYGRVARIDAEQRSVTAANDDPVGNLRGRIAQAFGSN